jgi:N-hydroxyarylamine O-acetyltransferase
MSAKLQSYLQRIGYTGAIEPNIDNLRAIHRAHMLSVPFENLDIHVGRWIVLDEDKLFHKIVHERRGGFCFEQNGLFYAMLREMGYDVVRIEANVRGGDGEYSIPMNHMALHVNLDGKRWIADVGFGDSYLEPLELDNHQPQTVAGRHFKIEHDGTTGYYLYPDENGNWQIQYRFFFLPHELANYNDACYYMQTSPKTHFTQKRVCSVATAAGRISLSDLRLIERKGDVRTETLLADEAEFDNLLLERFGIDLSPARAAADRV